MEKLKALKDIRTEILMMDFSFQNLHRMMFLVFETKSILESTNTIPNKEIALDQTNKLIENELMEVIRTEGENDIKQAFNNLLDNFKLVLSYYA